jgi:hypothetical protein
MHWPGNEGVFEVIVQSIALPGEKWLDDELVLSVSRFILSKHFRLRQSPTHWAPTKVGHFSAMWEISLHQ